MDGSCCIRASQRLTWRRRLLALAVLLFVVVELHAIEIIAGLVLLSAGVGSK